MNIIYFCPSKDSSKNVGVNKEILCFEVVINKIFAEKLDEDQILSENMLYRLCLIKLVDFDDPENLNTAFESKNCLSL